ncbi:MAG: hypothetical protein RIS19_588, partial [Actinomycetota bacterium]
MYLSLLKLFYGELELLLLPVFSVQN